MQIKGPTGALQVQIDSAENGQDVTAIMCHPHPQYGGSMHDAVLQTAADVLLQQGIRCVRFNFRGVGTSEGKYDGGTGEVDDLLAVTSWVSDKYTDQKVWWLGYSFGAAMVWQALKQYTPIRGIMIAPPVSMMNFADIQSTSRLDAIAGDQDDFVDINALENWQAVNTLVIPGADHFFSAHHAELSRALAGLLNN
jgi:alpha/beta superfamily hydrolase